MVWFFLGLFLGSFFLLGRLLWPFISILVMAGVVSGLFHPVFRRIQVRGVINAPMASFLTCVLIFFLLFVPLFFFVGILSREAYDLYLRARDAVLIHQLGNLVDSSRVLERINQLLSGTNLRITGDELNRVISEMGKFVGLFLYEQARSITSNVLSFVVNFFFMLLIVFYLLMDGARLLAFIRTLSPLPDEQDEKLMGKFRDMAGAILVVNGASGLLQGILGGLVFMIFGLESPFLWGVVMAMLAFLPILGIGAVFIPASVYLFMAGRPEAGLFFIVFYIILSGGVEYFLKPRLVGGRVKMHTLLVFLAVLGGLKLFGILGVVYGPLVATGFLTLTDIYQSSYRQILVAEQKDCRVG